MYWNSIDKLALHEDQIWISNQCDQALENVTNAINPKIPDLFLIDCLWAYDHHIFDWWIYLGFGERRLYLWIIYDGINNAVTEYDVRYGQRGIQDIVQ